jgi:hypothetical protein
VTGIEPALSAWESGPSGALTCPELRSWLSASDREIPVFTGVNGTLMARRSWTAPSRITLRPSAFQAGHIPSWHKSCESYPLSPVADDSGWLLLLLSPLLSAVGSFPHLRGLPADDSVTSWSPSPSPGLFPATRPRPVLSQAPPPNPTAAGPDGRRVLSGGGVAGPEAKPRS